MMELQMVMMLKVNQWKWMLNSLKMLMIRKDGTANGNDAEDESMEMDAEQFEDADN
jgi:hypothetical protein